MNIIKALKQHLGWKLFITYLLVMIIAVVVLDITAEFQIPKFVARHINEINLLSNIDNKQGLDTYLQFAVYGQLVIGTVVGILAAGFASAFITDRIVKPIQEMMYASQRIAAGDYHERIIPNSQDELGRLAESFNHMAELLERTEQRRIELIGIVAHELRTPLTSLKSILEGLGDGVLPYDPATFTDLQRETSRLQRLVQDLEELSRFEAGQIHLNLNSVKIGDLVESVANRLRPQYEDKNVSLNLEIANDLSPINGDPQRLTQVFLNLLGNALLYTFPGGQVTVKAEQSKDELKVTIHDTGVGISAEHVPHIFERFYRVDKSLTRSGGGSGIGLTIAKHLVEAHGGQLSVSSAGLNQGSTFSFSLPKSFSTTLAKS